MTTINLFRAVLEQALGERDRLQAELAALRAALAQQAEPVQDQDVEDAIEAAYWQFDCRKKGLNEWASAPQSERDAFKAEARKLVRGYFPTRQAQDTKREMLAVADAFIRGKRAALAQQAEPDHETRAELAEQQVVQLAEERDHYRNLWQKAQQAEPVAVFDEQQGQPVLLSGAPLLADEQPLYTAPLQRKPLTEEEIEMEWSLTPQDEKREGVYFARRIERAHKIGEGA